MSDKKHVHTLSELYAHPIAHNIAWAELVPALVSIGAEHIEHEGKHRFTRNGHTVVFEHSSHDTVSEDEIMKLRHFLHASAVAQNKAPDRANDMIVAIDHHQARIFSSPGMVGEARSEEYANVAKSRLLHRRPTSPPYNNTGPIEDDDYYESVIGDLNNARRIVILSHGTGSSNAAFLLMAQINKKNPSLAHRVTAIQRCDLEAMSEEQITALGKSLL